MLRVFRVLRILRLLKGAKGVRDLLMTLVLSFPALVNVFGLLALCMFIFALLGLVAGPRSTMNSTVLVEKSS